MTRGRHTAGPELVMGMEGSVESRQRLKLILESLSGHCTNTEAAAELGISESRFYELRAEALQGALASLEPGLAGRPPKSPPEEGRRLAELQKQLGQMKVMLRAAQLREELAAVMPHVLQRNKKNSSLTPPSGGSPSRSQRKHARRRKGGKSST